MALFAERGFSFYQNAALTVTLSEAHGMLIDCFDSVSLVHAACASP